MSMCWCSRIVGVARLLFESGDYFVQHFRRCGDYSRAATNRERRLIERIRYSPFVCSYVILTLAHMPTACTLALHFALYCILYSIVDIASSCHHHRCMHNAMPHICSLVPRRPDLFNCTREKRGSLVKLITCVTSGGTNFHIWHNSELAKIKPRVRVLQSVRYNRL